MEPVWRTGGQNKRAKRTDAEQRTDKKYLVDVGARTCDIVRDTRP